MSRKRKTASVPAPTPPGEPTYSAETPDAAAPEHPDLLAHPMGSRIQVGLALQAQPMAIGVGSGAGHAGMGLPGIGGSDSGWQQQADHWVVMLMSAAEIDKAPSPSPNLDDSMKFIADSIRKRLTLDLTLRAEKDKAINELKKELEDTKLFHAASKAADDTPKRSRKLTLSYANALLDTISEAVNYDPKRHHNRPPPDLRISDDPEYLRGLKDLAKELRRFNDLLAKNSISSREAQSKAIDFNHHLNSFLASFAPSMGKGVTTVLVGLAFALLIHAGLPEATIGGLWKLIPKIK